ncbi:luciferase family protein [Paenibacillus harenae]|uniref:luciferase domain-containing protein n=1 Tax=Paenibacillus harenae TaxID=306543 RepID=UPI0003FB2645|nr:luciferase family protein [Paenibacillus harenae]
MSGNGGKVLTEELSSWAGVTIHPHRFGGIEFQLNGKEIGHLHGDRLFDLLLPKSERDRWVNEGKAMAHHMYPGSGWVSVYLNTEQDVSHAIEIARSKYDQMNLRRM